ncbi:N-acetyltransferase B complex [Macleaya cordata]|uniref:N-acetyltransferase B complex n=1 Tax=Macleaya cordata TaxID=56857 RepID=A0A200R7W1_MACCD|nr:N-acetyltransferase B complex [Macleaya cordata]
MASPPGFQQFLRIILTWEAIEDGELVKALKLNTVLLAKDTKFPYLLALNGLILEQMRRPDEALMFSLMAKEKIFSNDDVILCKRDITLSTIKYICECLQQVAGHLATTTRQRVLNDLDKMVELMERFKIHVYQFQFEGQHQMALNMYEVTGEERFLHWAISSMQLQVFFGKDTNGVNKLLDQAEGLIEKHVASHNLQETEGTLLVYLSILEHNKKYDIGLQVLSGEMGTLLPEVDRLRLQGRLLASGSHFPAAAEIFKKVFESCPDDWTCFLDYLGCLLEDDSRWSADCRGTIFNQIRPWKFVDCKLTHLSPEVFHLRISEALSFVKMLQSKTSAAYVRCPFLANVEVERRKRLYGVGEDAKFMEALLDYFRRFGDSVSFTRELHIPLQVLTEEEDRVLLEKFHTSIASPSILQVKGFEGLITIFKIEEWFGNLLKCPVGEVEGTILSKTQLYFENLAQSKDLCPQQTIQNDELLCMACTSMVQLFWRTRDIGYFVEAIMVLEFGLNIQRSFQKYKILLVHLYSCFTSLPVAYEWYKTLDVKGILFESMSQHILPQMLLSPHWASVSPNGNVSNENVGFKASTDLGMVVTCKQPSLVVNKILSLSLALCFPYPNCFKSVPGPIKITLAGRVIKIVQSKNQLQHSHQYLIARIESSILLLKKKANVIEDVERFLDSLNSGIHSLELSSEESCKSLTFNDELESRPWWTPIPEINYLVGPFHEQAIRRQRESWWIHQELIEAREVNARIDIERRTVIPRLIYLSLKCASAFMQRSLQARSSTLVSDSIRSELVNLLIRYANSLCITFSQAVDIIDKISIGQTPVEGIPELEAFDLMNFAVFLNAWKLGVMHQLDSWKKLDLLIEKYTQAKVRCMMQPVISSPGFGLNVFIRIVSEPVAWQILIIQSCVKSLPSSTGGKKERKRWDTDEPYISRPLVQAISSSIESMYRTIEGIMKSVKEQSNSTVENKVERLLSPLQRPGRSEGPVIIFQTLEVAALLERRRGGTDRISEALHSWDAAQVAKKIINAQERTLLDFLAICQSKLDLLQNLKVKIQLFT